jgi:hypothetical protein
MALLFFVYGRKRLQGGRRSVRTPLLGWTRE